MTKETVSFKNTATEKYNNNPNRCLYCNKKIEIKEGKTVYAVRAKKFCDNSCSAAFNNKKRKKKIKKSKFATCKSCNEQILLKIGEKWGNYIYRKYCDKCLPDALARRNGAEKYAGNLTKAYIFKRYKKYYIGRNVIRRHAQKVFDSSNKQKKCLVCGYDKHVDIAHAKAVSDFEDNALLSVINDIENLITLCPTHHWEYDNGLLKISDMKSNIAKF